MIIVERDQNYSQRARLLGSLTIVYSPTQQAHNR